MTDKNQLRRMIISKLLTDEQVTRPSLVEALGVRPATLLQVVDELKSEGLVDEPERKGKRTGRRASPITLNGEFAYIIGFDLQVERCAALVMDFTGEVLERESIDSKGAEKDAAAAMREVGKLTESLRKRLGAAWRRVKAVGFADPGLVDIERGLAIKAVNIKNWSEIDVAGWLRKSLKVDVCAAHPSPLARTFVEYRHRRPGNAGGLFHMELGMGIGGGFIKDDRLFVGDTHCAMEVGHLVVAPDGPLCQCGNKGCLEAVAGTAGIRKKIVELLENGVQTRLRAENFSVRHFIECVGAGDKAAVSLAHEIGERIGLGLSAIVALLNPSSVVFSGDLAGLGAMLVEDVKRTLTLHCFPAALNRLEIAISTLDDHATALGAALLARQRMLKERGWI